LAAVVALLVSVGAESKSLGARATGVDNIDVVHLQVGCPSSQGSSEIVVGGVILTLALCDGDSVGGKAARVSGLSVNGESRLKGRNVDLLLVGTYIVLSAR
jgi:hypothetical protein